MQPQRKHNDQLDLLQPAKPKRETVPAKALAVPSKGGIEGNALHSGYRQRTQTHPADRCRHCGAIIKIPGLDQSLCSAKCGWVVDSRWQTQFRVSPSDRKRTPKSNGASLSSTSQTNRELAMPGMRSPLPPTGGVDGDSA